MDIRMPGMDGIEATRHLTAGPDTAGVRVLVLTTFDADEYVYRGAARRCERLPAQGRRAAGDLIAAVQTVAPRATRCCPGLTRRLIETTFGRHAGRRRRPRRRPCRR